MYEAYFMMRYMDALRLASEAKTETERALHLRNLRYYEDLIDSCANHRTPQPAE